MSYNNTLPAMLPSIHGLPKQPVSNFIVNAAKGFNLVRLESTS